jgi:hypothetical protein
MHSSARLWWPTAAHSAYLGGELTGGTAGRGSDNKVPFIGAVAVDENGHSLRAKSTQLQGFTRKAIAEWASANLSPASTVISDGLACFRGVTDVGCAHQPIVVGTRKPDELPMFDWVNTVLGNVKTRLSGAYDSFGFSGYAERYLGAIAYRFNRSFDPHVPCRRGCWSLRYVASRVPCTDSVGCNSLLIKMGLGMKVQRRGLTLIAIVGSCPLRKCGSRAPTQANPLQWVFDE